MLHLGHVASRSPVTPTMTNGWAAKSAKTTAPSTEDSRTSLTPKLSAVLENMSNEKASAGRMLLVTVNIHSYTHIVAPWQLSSPAVTMPAHSHNNNIGSGRDAAIMRTCIWEAYFAKYI